MKNILKFILLIGFILFILLILPKLPFLLWLLGHLFKLQKNWILESIFLAILFILIGLFIWWGLKLIRYRQAHKQTKWWKETWQTLWFYPVIIFNIGFILASMVHIGLASYIAISDTHKLSDYVFDHKLLQNGTANAFIYDQNGNQVYKVIHNSKNRDYVGLNEMPSYLTDAFVDIEDKSFYYHSGVSFTGYLRSLFLKAIHPEDKMHGGSTITQQLIKNVNGDINHRNLIHKWQEATLSWVIEQRYSKDEILEMYMNQIYLGKGVYGVGTAAKQFFHKNVYDLTLIESAFLAGLPKAPERYIHDSEKANARKNTVLKVMKENGSITQNQYEKALQQPIPTVHDPVKQSSHSLDAYVDYVLKEAKEDYGLSEGEFQTKGYRIYTYLDTDFQNHMYHTAQSFSYPDDHGESLVQVGMAAVDNNSHKIIALYGGRNFIKGYLNRSYQYYQPGSILKPLVVYGPAFETGKWNRQSKVLDEEYDFGGYTPKNAGDKYEGEITVERALIRSANIPAVKVLEDIGVHKGIKALKKMGIEIKKEDKQLHIALGGMEKGVTPIQMAGAFSVFPNYGYFETPKAIKFIKDHKGNIIKKKKSVKGTDVFSSQYAYEMTEILQKVVTDPDGTGKNADIGVPSAGKTGTTPEPGTNGGSRDAWYVGYTPNITMSVHFGFDQPSETNYLNTSGGGAPAKLYSDVMKYRAVAIDFQKPESLKEREEKAFVEAETEEFGSSWSESLDKFILKLEEFGDKIKTEVTSALETAENE